MSYDYKRVIQVAENEIGYLEKNDKSNLDDKTANAGNKNYTKYARDLDTPGVMCLWTGALCRPMG